jgi:hypothetical protein
MIVCEIDVLIRDVVQWTYVLVVQQIPSTMIYQSFWNISDFCFVVHENRGERYMEEICIIIKQITELEDKEPTEIIAFILSLLNQQPPE